MSGTPLIRNAGSSDPGLKRSVNEDSILLHEDHGFWLVADGMGGHERGDVASQAAVAGFAACSLPADFESAVQEVANRFYQINHQLWEAGDPASAAHMGTTAVALLIRDKRFAVLWVGDSRAYIFRSGGLFQLSTDHTQVQELVDEGILTQEDARNHPMSHVLSRALGVAPAVQVDIVQDQLEVGDRFLLCSDGLTGPVDDNQIRILLGNPDPHAAARSLIAAAHDAGAPDNVSVIIVDALPPTGGF